MFWPDIYVMNLTVILRNLRDNSQEMTDQAKIVHESETQRQFVRLQLPAMAEIEGTHYPVKDLSSGGMAIRDFAKFTKKGKILDLTLLIPFSDFTLDISLKAEAQYIDKKNGTCGCRFIDLTSNQIAILNHVITSFMSGNMIGGEDIIHIVSRENFVNVRNHKTDAPLTLTEKAKKYTAYGFITFLTLILSLFILNNLFDKLFTLKTPHAYVAAKEIIILSPVSGTFTSRINSNLKTIKAGQIIGYINTNSPLPHGQTQSQTPVISQCDCFILKRNIIEKEYRPENAPLFTLIPQKKDINIVAIIPIDKVHQLQIGTEAQVNLSATKRMLRGIITNIKKNNDPMQSANTEPTARVTITTKKALALDEINTPAFIEFLL